MTMMNSNEISNEKEVRDKTESTLHTVQLLYLPIILPVDLPYCTTGGGKKRLRQAVYGQAIILSLPAVIHTVHIRTLVERIHLLHDQKGERVHCITAAGGKRMFLYDALLTQATLSPPSK